MSRKTAYSSFSTKATPQRQQAREDQVKNSAGGFVFQISAWAQLDRFLILGTEGGTYYVGQTKLTKDNAQNVQACIKEDGLRVVKRVIEISDAGRAPSNDPALFALALAASVGDNKTRKAAMEALPQVARTGTHLFHFAQFVNNMRGWGRLLRDGIGKWYQDKNESQLAYQLIKYQQRDGWSHRDLLRLSHPLPLSATQNMLFHYAVKGEMGDNLPVLIGAFEEAKTASANRVIELIREHGLTREMIPTELLNRVDVWEALLEKMPLDATLRNLGKMSSIGLLTPMSDASKKVVAKFEDQEYIRKSRLHPLAVLVGMKTYQQGHGMKGSLSWSPVGRVVDALDDAFYLAFGNVEPANKRTFIGLDVSRSMGAPFGGTFVSCCEGATAMAMVTARTEPEYVIGRFNQGLQLADISPRQRMDDILRWTRNINGGGTDCAMPMVYAEKNRIPVDTFVVYTDNETWAGYVHPFQALKSYRQKMGIPAKLVVVGMTATNFSIADSSDDGMLDVVGFSTDTPQVISDFSRGDA